MTIVYDRVRKVLAESSYNWKSFLDYGVHEAFGSDAPVESFNPILGIYCSVSRKNLQGTQCFLPNQSISIDNSLFCYIYEGAYCSNEDHYKGMIKEGYLADFVILNQILTEIPTENILETQVIAPYFSGECVYQSH
jgi:predicted amidohydrolase YtcJ